MSIRDEIKDADNDPCELFDIAKERGVGEELAEKIGIAIYTYDEAWERESDDYVNRTGDLPGDKSFAQEVSEEFIEIGDDSYILWSNLDGLSKPDDLAKELFSILQDQIIQEEKGELATAISEVQGETQSPGLTDATSTPIQRKTRRRVL